MCPNNSISCAANLSWTSFRWFSYDLADLLPLPILTPKPLPVSTVCERVSQSVTEVALELLVKLKREFYLNKMSPFWKFSRIQVWPLTSESAFVGRSPNFVPFLLISEEALDMLTSLAGQALAYSDFSSAAFQLSHKYFPMLDIQNCMFRLSSSWMTQLFGFSICCVVTGYMKNMKIKL